MTKTMTELAQEYLNKFECATRDNGSEFYRVKDKYSHAEGYYTSDLYRMITDVHGDMPPDDYKYRFIIEALDMIVDNSGTHPYLMEPDTYAHDLISWLGSNLTRISYFDEALAEWPYDSNKQATFFALAQESQVNEKNEVASIVINHLESLIEDSEVSS